MTNRITDLIDDADNMGTREHYEAFVNAVLTEFTVLSFRPLPISPSIIGMMQGAYQDGTKPDEFAAYLCDWMAVTPQVYANWFPYEPNDN